MVCSQESGGEVTGFYNLSDQIHCEARVVTDGTVCLWMGVSVGADGRGS